MNDATFLRPATTSATPSRRDLLIGGAMLATAVATYARLPRARIASIGPKQLDKLIPLQFGHWRFETTSGLVQPPPDALSALLYDQQVSRVYVADDAAPVMLSMAYGNSQGGMLQVHRPEICYPASGFRLTETRLHPIVDPGHRTIPARSFTATSDVRNEQVLYWTRIADMLPTGWTVQRLDIMRSNLAGKIPDGLLVRFSTTVEDGDRAFATLERFARELLVAVGPGGRRKLLGEVYGE